MKLKMHVTLDDGKQVYLPEETVKVGKKLGEYLLDRGYASLLAAPAKEPAIVEDDQGTDPDQETGGDNG